MRQFICRIRAVNMRSKERVLTFIEDWHFSGVCWMHIVQITKPVIRKVTRLILSQKKKKRMKSLLLKWREKSPLAKYLSATANLIEGDIASRNFVSFLWLLGPIFSGAKSQSHFPSSWRNSCILNNHLHATPAEHHWTASAASTNVSYILAVYFFSLQIHIPHIFQLQLHSTAWLDRLDTPSKCGHKTLYANCPLTLYVRWRGLGLQNGGAHNHCWSGNLTMPFVFPLPIS